MTKSHTYHSYNFTQRLNKITDTSLIRIQKLLEIVQYMFIYLILGFIGGIIIEKIFPVETKKSVKKMSTLSLFGTFTIRFTLLGIVTFYINKIAELFPFIFHLTSSYQPGLKGEPMYVKIIAFTYVFYKSQPTLEILTGEIIQRIKGML